MAMLQVLVISLLVGLSAADRMEIAKRGFAKWKALTGLSRDSVLNEPTTCQKAIDLGIVMEKRTDLDWSLVKTFVSKLLSKFPLNHDMTHIGAIAFDQNTDLLLKFDDLLFINNYKQAVFERMRTWGPGHASSTTYDKVIDKALLEAGTELFTSAAGARGYDEVLLLLTDGKQIQPGVPGETSGSIARALERDRNIKIIVVGVGGPDLIELSKISQTRMYFLKDESSLDSEADEVAKAICSMAAP